MSRPTIYNEDMLIKAEEYLNGGYKKEDKVIPSMVGLALELNVHKSTLYEWMNNEDHELSDTLKKIAVKQESELINGGLSNKFNAQITKLILGNHGYSDKVDNTNTLDLSKLSDEQLEALAGGKTLPTT